MKINLEFYEAANNEMKTCIKEFEEDLVKFKEICDAINTENKFGVITDVTLSTLSNNIYTYSSEKLSTILEDISSIVEGYMTEMDEEDVL